MGIKDRVPGTGKYSLREGNAVMEWIAAAIGFVIVSGLVAVLLAADFTEKKDYPDITIRTDTVIGVREGFLVRFTAENHGDRTAAHLEVTGSLRYADREQAGGDPGSDIVETVRAVIDYLPAGSEHGGGLFFTLDPERYRLELRASGYQEP